MLQLLNVFIYRWYGVSEEGAYLQGEMRAPNLSVVIAHLLSFGIQVTRIKRKIFALRMKKILTSHTRIQLTEQLANLISAGISMPRALNALEKAFSDVHIKTFLWFMQRHIEAGQSLGAILYLFPKEFNLAYRQLVEIGESSGQLEKVLIRLADLEKKQVLIGYKIKKASFYPLIVLMLSLFIMLFLIVGIVPEFIEIFNQAKVTLPLATLLLVNTSDFLIRHAIFIGFILLSGFGAYGYFFHTSVQVKKLTSKSLLSLPWLGKIIHYFFLNRFSYGLSALLQVGIPVTQSIEMLLKNVANPFYAEIFRKLLDLIKEGNSLSQALKSSFLFPDFFVYTVKMGEESGLTVQSLVKVAAFYEAEIDRFVDGMSLFLEPILMIILGVIVGVFMVALYLPIFSLGNAI